MSIDISKYVEVVMGRLDKHSYYSEMDSKDLSDTIDRYLTDMYDEKMAVLSTELALDKAEGIEIDSKKYKRAYDKIRRDLMLEAYDVALGAKPDLIKLPKVPEL